MPSPATAERRRRRPLAGTAVVPAAHAAARLLPRRTARSTATKAPTVAQAPVHGRPVDRDLADGRPTGCGPVRRRQVEGGSRGDCRAGRPGRARRPAGRARRQRSSPPGAVKARGRRRRPSERHVRTRAAARRRRRVQSTVPNFSLAPASDRRRRPRRVADAAEPPRHPAPSCRSSASSTWRTTPNGSTGWRATSPAPARSDGRCASGSIRRRSAISGSSCSQSDRGTSVRLTAETEAARQILADAQPRLAAEARAQGVRIAETHVDSSGPASAGTARSAPPGREPQTATVRTARGAARPRPQTSAEAGRADSDRYA